MAPRTSATTRKIGEEVLAWQASRGCQHIPNPKSRNDRERLLGKRFCDVLRRRSCAIGDKPCQQQLSADDVDFINEILLASNSPVNTASPGDIEADVPVVKW